MQRDLHQTHCAPAAALHAEPKPLECPLPTRWKRLSRRVAQIGFLFFLLKGIAWLVVAFLAWQGVT